MLYVRKLFTQDLRNGKQIAFPKEASYSFFSFDYINGEEDRNVRFTFRACFNQFQQYDGREINTRLYAAGSESRMDGQVKAFIRDELNAQVDDLLIFKNKGTKNNDYEFMFVPKSNKQYYKLLLKLTNSENHSVFSFEEQKIDKIDFDYPLQQIFYGAPGTGKSKKVGRDILPKDDKFVFRTTFHPDSDYSSFVGCYKPLMDGDKIKYDFSPQVFMDAYIAAWQNLNKGNKCYLVIEEINRGNCAQIFGDLFQLLDRDKNTGYSEYPIKANKDLRLYLEALCTEEKLNEEAIKEGKLRLPPNLNIIATMNTSDQSLFPMDSAFKRRWDWEYVPIEYDNPVSAEFDIMIDGVPQKWHEFLKNVNEKIKQTTASEDKQMGNFFIKRSVNEKEFCDKVMFYLWSEVGKDNYKTSDAIFKWRDEKDEDHDFTFSELYISEEERKKLLKGFICFVKDESRKNTEAAVDINEEDSETDAE